ncbi:MAG: signal transduction histidine kinase [Cellvibrionaceae bacterium]|jgi:signal transduction histidine kinase
MSSLLSLQAPNGTRRSNLANYLIFGFFGLFASFFLGWLVIRMLMGAPLAELQPLVGPLAFSGILSLAFGFLATWYTAQVSRSLLLTLVSAYAWSTILIILNFWNGARLMFFSNDHDLPLAVSLLVFASILSSAFGLAIVWRIVADLRELSQAAAQIAEGNLTSRSMVRGRDEVSQVASSFNNMAEKLEEAEGVRNELQQLRRDLISWTSHDLRTPLTSMRAMIEAIQDGVVEDPEMMKRYYKHILNDIEGLNTLMDDLFEYSQLESGGLKYEMMSQPITSVVINICEQFEAVANQQNITLSCEVKEQGLGTVYMDARLISRVLGNLVKNACRHTPANGSIAISTYRDKSGPVIVSVKDSGSGFAAADLPHVFEQFYRGEEARSRAKGGGGLGLAIAKSIVEGHSGSISASNDPVTHGAVVTFSLPRV